MERGFIEIRGAREHNLQDINLQIERGAITVITGVSGSGKSSLAFDTILAEAQRRFFYTLSHYTRQFLDLGTRPAVAAVHGLSPAIALAQNETQASIRATVGSLTDISELLGVLFARFGEKNCPSHNLPTAQVSIESLVDRLLSQYSGKSLAILAPIVEKKRGLFQKQLSSFAEKGYLRALIDGELVSLSPIPQLNKDQKHDISILIDLVEIKEARLQRLKRSLATALELGQGLGEMIPVEGRSKLIATESTKFSLREGCPECGYSWPKLDSRYFSSNSLGSCQTCRGLGFVRLDEDESLDDVWALQSRLCSSCAGTGLRRELASINFAGISPQQSQSMTIQELWVWVKDQAGLCWQNPACLRILDQLQSQLQRVVDVGLGYLTLARRVRSLSGGEAQRLRLSGVLGENLRGVLYVLDEPSQGLAPSEIGLVWNSLRKLKEAGNTIIVVDHDEGMIRRADWVVDLGPAGGHLGGQVMAKFRPEEAAKYANVSVTAKYLSEKIPARLAKTRKTSLSKWLVINKPKLFHLKMPQLKFPLGALTLVHGVSGSGKSSAVVSILYRNMENYLQAPKDFQPSFCQSITGLENIEKVVLIDRKAIAKSSVSMPATYLDLFKDLRTLFAKLPEAQIAGLTDRDFSLSVEGGRCPECKGKGQLSLSMKFLADARVVCPVCDGQRYQPHVLDVRYRNHSLADILNLTLVEVLELFASHRRIQRKLQPAVDLGLGYLKLGQPSSHLSGGESQRLKLAPLLSKEWGNSAMLILDEPTRGLHFADVALLMDQLLKIRDQGASIVVIEHHEMFHQLCDWRLEFGPGAAHEGGELVHAGEPDS